MKDVFEGVSDETLVAEAKEFYAVAQDTEQSADSLKQRASDDKWAAADRVHALVQRGWTHRKVAAEIGVAHGTVGRWARMVDRYLSKKRPLFAEAYAEIDGSAGTDKTYERHATAFVKQASPDKVAAVLKSAPVQTQAAVVVQSGAEEGVQEVIGMSDDKTLAVIEGAEAASKVNLGSKDLGGKKPKKKSATDEVKEGQNGSLTGVTSDLAEMKLSLEMMGAAANLVDWAKKSPTSERLIGAIEVLEEGIELARAVMGGTVSDEQWSDFEAAIAAAGSEE